MNREDLIKAIEEMTVLELSELVKALEDKFGVSAAAPMAMPMMAMPGAGARRRSAVIIPGSRTNIAARSRPT